MRASCSERQILVHLKYQLRNCDFRKTPARSPGRETLGTIAMRRTIFILTLIVFFACNDNHVSENLTQETTIRHDTPAVTSHLTSLDTISQPSRQFLRLVKQIDTAGYIWDTTRIKNVTHYFRTDSIVTIDNYVFYKMKLKDSWIIEFYELNKDKRDEDSPIKEGLIKKEYFENAISLFGYYYRQKNKADLMVDGYIEEWLFPTQEDAEKAVKDVHRVKHMVYFNTTPFYCQIDKRIYILHVRASGFSIPMRQFFKRFVKENQATVPNSRLALAG
jgi:hypothetical protein